MATSCSMMWPFLKIVLVLCIDLPDLVIIKWFGSLLTVLVLHTCMVSLFLIVLVSVSA